MKKPKLQLVPPDNTNGVQTPPKPSKAVFDTPDQTVYIDREQSSKFSVGYHGPGVLTVRADTLIASKGCGYDDNHMKILQPLRAQYITLKRDNDDAPGWWHIVTKP